MPQVHVPRPFLSVRARPTWGPALRCYEDSWPVHYLPSNDIRPV